jgi:diaminopropionate ammonia-lyase
MTLRCIVRERRRASVPAPAAARTFHAALPGYRPSPLVDAPALAARCGIGRVLVKDESDRFGLPAFKFLGASYAISRLLGGGADVASLRAAARAQGIERLRAATDGNHGRAVARMAALLHLRSTIYVPASMREARRAAIAAEGADVVDVAAGYDAAVRRATDEAAADDGSRAVNDADLDGTSPVAGWVIDGYSTLFEEVDEQCADGAVDLVLLQMGVGAFAAAGARWAAAHAATAVGVEPAGAACVTASLVAGQPVEIATTGTAMAGLDAATPSRAAWPSLAVGLAGSIVVRDDEADAAARDLAALGLAAGESGAAGLAGLLALAADPACGELRAAVGLGRATTALVVVTEGVTDPERYARVVAGA